MTTTYGQAWNNGGPIVGVWWAARARHTFNGPIRNVEFDEGAGIS